MKEGKKKKGSCFGTLLKIILVIVLLFVVLIAAVQIRNNQLAKEKEQERENSYSSSYWPDTELAAMLPEPDSEYGALNSSREDYLSVTVGHASSDDFQDYISECKELGYTVDYYESSTMYTAENEEGYDLSLYYDDNDEEMDIRLNAPKEETESATTESTVETEPQTEATQSVEMVDGMRVEFKEAMDSYEEFFDSYCEFMVKYAESDNAISMLSDYMNFMSQYSETMDALDALGEEDLNDAELAYYTEVSLRISEKLLETTQAIGEE